MSDTNDKPRSIGKPQDDASLGDVVDYVKAYAKQETVGPLKGAGRWLGFGAGAAFAMGLGLVIVLLGVLRLIQAEFDSSRDRLTVVGRLRRHAGRDAHPAGDHADAGQEVDSQQRTEVTGSIAMATNETVTDSKITPEDLRAKLQAFQGDVQGKVDDQKMSIATSPG